MAVPAGCRMAARASLMARPHDVAAAVEAMRAACTLPVTVKNNYDLDRYEDMANFVDIVSKAEATASQCMPSMAQRPFSQEN